MIFYKKKILEENGSIIYNFSFATNLSELKEECIRKNEILISAKPEKFNFKRKSHDKFLIMFFEGLRELTNSYTSLIPALKILKVSFDDLRHKLFIEKIIALISSGLKFSKTLKIFETLFDPIIIKFIEVSEKTGSLSGALTAVCEYLEEKKEFQDKLSQLLKYPILLITVVFLVLIFWTTFITPKFVELFEEMNIQLNLTMKIFYYIGCCFKNLYFYIFIPLIIFVFYFLIIKNNLKRFIWKIPALKKNKETVWKVNFFLILYVMTREKINIVEIFDFLDPQSKILKNLRKGFSITNSLKLSGYPFNSWELSILEIGEKSARIGEASELIYKKLKTELFKKLQNFISFLQPLMIIFIGALLSILVFSLIVPLYSNLIF